MTEQERREQADRHERIFVSGLALIGVLSMVPWVLRGGWR